MIESACSIIVVESFCSVAKKLGEACYRQGRLESGCVLEDALQRMRKAVNRDHIVAAFEDLIVRGHAAGTCACDVIGDRQSVESKCPCMDYRKEVTDVEQWQERELINAHCLPSIGDEMG